MPFDDFMLTKARGTAITLDLAVTSGGSPLDITAWTDIIVIGKLSLTARDSDAVIYQTLATGGVTRDVGTGGLAHVTISGTATHALPNRERVIFIEILGVDASSNIFSLAMGQLKVTPVVASAGVFRPTAIAGLKGWIRADITAYKDTGLTTLATADDDAIGGWKGQGGAGRAFLQPTSGKRPVKKLAVLNGLPTIHADGTNDYLMGANLGLFITPTDFTMFMVARATVGGSGNVDTWPALFMDQTGGCVIGVGSAGKVGISNTTAIGRDEALADYTLNTFAVIEARHAAGTIGIRVNGGTEVTASSGNTLPVLGGVTLKTPVSLFGALGSTLFAAADIAEFLCWNVALSAGDKAKVRTYLSGRYGIPSIRAAVTQAA